MKGQRLLYITLLSSALATAQITNTFPDDGRAGIGTTSPSSELEVKSVTGNDSEIHINTASDGEQSIIRFQDAGQTTWGFLSNYPGSGKFSLYNYQNTSVALTADQDGDIGIGTTNPQAKLDLNGNLLLRETTSSLTNGDVRLFNHSGTTWGFMIRPYDTSFNGGTWDWTQDFGYRADTKNWYVETNFGIGTTNPGTYRLAVKGKIRAEEIKVETGWADYVFKEDYDLPTLEEVARHIQEKGHLINIPSAKEVEENGIQLGEMNKLLLEKIEELTLYTLQQQKQLVIQKEKNKSLEERLARLEKHLEPK